MEVPAPGVECLACWERVRAMCLAWTGSRGNGYLSAGHALSAGRRPREPVASREHCAMGQVCSGRSQNTAPMHHSRQEAWCRPPLLLDRAAHQKLLDLDAACRAHSERARDDLLLDGCVPTLVRQEDVGHRGQVQPMRAVACEQQHKAIGVPLLPPRCRPHLGVALAPLLHLAPLPRLSRRRPYLDPLADVPADSGRVTPHVLLVEHEPMRWRHSYAAAAVARRAAAAVARRAVACDWDVDGDMPAVAAHLWPFDLAARWLT
eukprot:5861815-Prymnesium_polylepis.2